MARTWIMGLVAIACAAGGIGLALGLNGEKATQQGESAAATRIGLLEKAVADRDSALDLARREIDDLRTRLARAERRAAAAADSGSIDDGALDASDRVAAAALDLFAGDEGESDEPVTLESVLARLTGRDPRDRFRALRDIEELSSEDKAKALEAVKELLGEDNPGLQFAAMEALLKLAPDEAMPLLAQFVGDAENPDFLRSRALDALAERQDPSAATAILKAYESGLKGPAARALQKLGDDSLARAWYDELALDLASADSAIRARAISSIGTLKLSSTMARVAEGAADPNSNVRQSVASALGEIGDPSGLPTLRRLAEDPVDSVRRSASFSIRRIENPDELRRGRGGDWFGGSPGGPGFGPGRIDGRRGGSGGDGRRSGGGGGGDGRRGVGGDGRRGGG